MKRYSISVLYSKDRFHYVGRTDNPAVEIEKFQKCLENWRELVKEEDEMTNDFIGLRIVDSKTKEVIFEEIHFSEELGYKKEYELVDIGCYGCQIRKGHWVKL